MSSISATPMPCVVTDGVPTRMPDATVTELIIDDDTFLDVESRDAIHFDEPVLVEDDALAADDVAAEEDVDAFAEDQADAFAEDQ